MQLVSILGTDEIVQLVRGSVLSRVFADACSLLAA